MANVVEHTLNDALGSLLRAKNGNWEIVTQATQVLQATRKVPDILIIAGASVIIETEFTPASTVYEDASQKLGVLPRNSLMPVEAVIAVSVPQRLKHIPQEELSKELEQADDLRFYILRGEPEKPERFPLNGWCEGGVDSLVDVIESLAVSPSRLNEAVQVMEDAVKVAATVLAKEVSIEVLIRMASCLNQEDSEQTRRMAAAIIANAFLFQIAVSGAADIPSIDDVRQKSQLGRLLKPNVLKGWEQILKINYWPIFSIANKLLIPVPDGPALSYLKVLSDCAQELVGIGVVEIQDLAGQMFGKLIADRKFLATFYTRPASAALLAEMAVSRLKVDWSDEQKIKELRVADLACGTGTLLSAAYRRAATRIRRNGLDDKKLHKHIIEKVVIGADVMPAAAHLTTTMLSATHPAIPFAECGVHVVPYGLSSDTDGIAIGSLELLGTSELYSLFGQQSARLSGVASQADDSREQSFNLPDESLDLCIMNPPFTRPTNHESTDVPIPSFAGFDTSDVEQTQMSKRLRKLTSKLPVIGGHGNAGLASNFIDLAHRKLRPGGVFAMVLPAKIITGKSWAKARALLSQHYEDLLVVSLSDVAGGQTARAFSADTGMAEVLIVASKLRVVAAGEKERVATYLSLEKRPAELLDATMIAHQSSILANALTSGDTVRLQLGEEELGWMALGEFASDMSVHPVGVAEPDVYALTDSLSSGSLRLPRIDPIALPVCQLADLGVSGPIARDINGKTKDKAGMPRGPFDLHSLVNRHQYRRASYPILWAHSHKEERKMTVLPDSKGHVRKGMSGAAKMLWHLHSNGRSRSVAGATKLHFSINFRLNSQSISACLTPDKSIGGRAWPSFQPDGGEDWEKALCVWLNSTLGLMSYWGVAGREQTGRANFSGTTFVAMPVVNLCQLDSDKIKKLSRCFDDFAEKPLKPANEAYNDIVREQLDEALLCDALGLPASVLEPLITVRYQWCCEPSVHGGKQTRPSGI